MAGLGDALFEMMMAADGALLGVTMAYIAYKTFQNYKQGLSTLHKIRDAPSVRPSDLRSVLSDGCGKLVAVRGSVEVLTAEKGHWSEKYVVLRRSLKACIYKGEGEFRFPYSQLNETSTTKVPFVLAQANKPEYVVVNMDGSDHSLPLTTIFRQFMPLRSTPLITINTSFTQAPSGVENPVTFTQSPSDVENNPVEMLLYQEKILPVKSNITAIGICYPKDGTFGIESCDDLPYFLSNLTKDEIVEDLSFDTKLRKWSVVFFGIIAIGTIAYCVGRNWIKWKEYRQREYSRRQQRTQQLSKSFTARIKLCVICQERRDYTLYPCLHVICRQCDRPSPKYEITQTCPKCGETTVKQWWK